MSTVQREAQTVPRERVTEGPIPEGRWRLDADRSAIGFRVRKMGLYMVNGRFSRASGGIDADARGHVTGDVTIDAASITTRMPPRDAHLRSPHFLDAGTHPAISFRIGGVERGEEGHRVRGTLSLNGVERPLDLDAHAHRAGPGRALVHVTGAIDRHDFGVRPPQPFEMVVGDRVEIDARIALAERG